MPIQLPDFTHFQRAKPDFSSIADFLPNVLEGYKVSRAPAQIQQEERKQQLANALAEMENQYYEPKTQSDIELKKAQVIQALANAEHHRMGGSMQGHAKNVADMRKILNDPNVPDDDKKLLRALFESDLAAKNSLVETRHQNMQYKPWASLKADEQYEILGQYKTLGIDQRRAIELWNNGTTPQMIAVERAGEPGMGESMGAPQAMQGMQAMASNNQGMQKLNTQPNATQVLPTTALTGANRGNINDSSGKRAEADYLGNLVTEWTAPFAQQIGNVSLKDLWTSIGKRNDPKATLERRQFLAAQMMGPDAALLNINLAGGSSANEAIKDLEQRMKLTAKTYGLTITPEDYRVATRLMHEALDKGARVREAGMKGATDFSHILNERKNQGKPEGGLGLVRRLKEDKR